MTTIPTIYAGNTVIDDYDNMVYFVTEVMMITISSFLYFKGKRRDIACIVVKSKHKLFLNARINSSRPVQATRNIYDCYTIDTQFTTTPVMTKYIAVRASYMMIYSSNCSIRRQGFSRSIRLESVAIRSGKRPRT